MKKSRRAETPLVERVLEFINRHGMLNPGDRLVVAVSGGADSVCLLHLLLKLRDRLKIDLHIAHLNHRLRGAEADEDAGYVSRLAEQLGLPLTVARRDVRAYQRRQRLSLEEAARQLRYDFLGEVASSIGAGQVAVGHTSDDYIETILLHLIRGTGTRGLTGLQPVVNWQSGGKTFRIIRPLLTTGRQATEEYCRQENLVPRFDSTNLSLWLLRNRVRHELLPLLRSYNPQVAEALLRTAAISGDDLAYLEKQTDRLRRRIARQQGNTIILDREALLRTPQALKRQLLRRVIGELLGTLKDIEARHIEKVINVLDKPAGRMIHLPEGLVFTIEYNRYLLGPDPAALSPFPRLEKESIPLKIPGETRFTGWLVSATITERAPGTIEGKPVATLPSAQSGSGNPLTLPELTARFDLDKTGRQLSLRSRRAGDRFQPLGMKHPKKVAEFMIDARIPRAWRERVPIVSSTDHILWVVGGRIDERTKVTGDTRSVLSLKFQPEPAG